MTPKEIEAAIRSTKVAELDQDTVLQVYAHMLAVFAASITEEELRRLILISASMYHSMNMADASLQMPFQATAEDDEDTNRFTGYLH
jgi:hypothetical protein